jgi:hypothetical protein
LEGSISCTSVGFAHSSAIRLAVTFGRFQLPTSMLVADQWLLSFGEMTLPYSDARPKRSNMR